MNQNKIINKAIKVVADSLKNELGFKIASKQFVYNNGSTTILNNLIIDKNNKVLGQLDYTVTTNGKIYFNIEPPLHFLVIASELSTKYKMWDTLINNINLQKCNNNSAIRKKVDLIIFNIDYENSLKKY